MILQGKDDTRAAEQCFERLREVRADKTRLRVDTGIEIDVRRCSSLAHAVVEGYGLSILQFTKHDGAPKDAMPKVRLSIR